MIQTIQRAIVLAPHPDDGEFSCGATLKRLSEQETEIWYVAFSPCTKSVPEGFPKDILYTELEKAVAHLGIPKERIITFDFPVRELPKYRQEILEELIKIKREVKPDLVLLPNSTDIHQDHHTIYEEGLRAFKDCSMIGYELPWNNLQATTNFHIKVDYTHLQAKWNAITEYKSQNFRDYSSFDFFEGLAKVRGTQVKADYAEAFELIRWIC